MSVHPVRPEPQACKQFKVTEWCSCCAAHKEPATVAEDEEISWDIDISGAGSAAEADGAPADIDWDAAPVPESEASTHDINWDIEVDDSVQQESMPPALAGGALRRHHYFHMHARYSTQFCHLGV